MSEHPDREDVADEQQNQDDAGSPAQGSDPSPAELDIPLPEESDAAEEA